MPAGRGDIDPAQINRLVRVDVGLVGDLGDVLRALLPRLERCDHSEWRSHIRAHKGDAAVRDITIGALLSFLVLSGIAVASLGALLTALLALYLLEVRGLRGPLVKSITTSSMIYRLGEKFDVPVIVHSAPTGPVTVESQPAKSSDVAIAAVAIA